MEIKKSINLLLVNLGLKAVEVKLEQMLLNDGVTVVEAEAFEVGQPIFAIAEDQKIALPIGEYTLEDGRVIEVVEEGIIGEIAMPEAEQVEEEPATPAEAPVGMEEAPAESPKAKKIIESIVKETQFSKEVEELKAQIAELKAQLEVKEPVAEVVEEEVTLAAEPIVYNPENATEVKRVNIAPNKTMTTEDAVMARLWGKK